MWPRVGADPPRLQSRQYAAFAAELRDLLSTCWPRSGGGGGGGVGGGGGSGGVQGSSGGGAIVGGGGEAAARAHTPLLIAFERLRADEENCSEALERIVCSCPSLRAASAATDAVAEEAAEGPGGAGSAGAPAGEGAPLLQVAGEEEEAQVI